MTLAPGTTLGRYQIVAPLGQGGMATVYKAYQPALERTVALKVIRRGFAEDPEFRERFAREAKAIARLTHPNIVQVFDFDEADGEVFLAMQYLQGGTLKERLARVAEEGRLPQEEAARIVREVASALEYAHRRGVIHRDVKPSNVMLTEEGSAVVTDFGIAKIVGGTQHTATGVGIGTPEYMSPEQGQGLPLDGRTDVYALGVVAYEMLTGSVPFTADTPFAVVLMHVRDPLPLPTKVSPHVGSQTERVLLRVLAKDPGARYQTAPEFATALADAVRADEHHTAPTVVVRPRAAAIAAPAPRPLRIAERPLRYGAAGVVGLAFGLVAAITFVPGPQEVAEEAPIAPVAATAAAVSPTTTPARSPVPAPKFAFPPKGALSYQAKLDGSEGFDIRSRTTAGDETARELRFVPGAIELVMLKDSGPTNHGVVFNTVALQSYVLEIEFSIVPGTTSGFSAILRRGPEPGGGRVFRLTFDARDESMQAIFFDPATQRSEPLTPKVQVPDLQKGRTVLLGVSAEPTRFSFFLDQRFVSQFSDGRITAASLPGFSIGSRKGTVRLLGVRHYALPTVPRDPRDRPERGALAFQAKLDGSAAEIGDQSASGDPAASEIVLYPGAIEIRALKDGADRRVSLSAQLPSTYVAELDLSLYPGSDGTVRSILRTSRDGQSSYVMRLDLARQLLELLYISPQNVEGRSELRLATGSLPDLRDGRLFTLAVVADASRFVFYLDERQVAAADDARIAAASGAPNIGFAGRSGALRVLGARYYATR